MTAGPGRRASAGDRGLALNFLALSGGTFASQLLNFLVILYVARVLGVTRFGEVALAQAIVLYFRLGSDLGLDMLGNRRVAARRDTVTDEVGRLGGVRLLNAAIAFGLLVALSVGLGASRPLSRLLVVFGLSLFPVAGSLEWAFAGLERMEFVGLSRVVGAAIWLVVVVLAVHGGADTMMVPVAYVTGLACAAGWLAVVFCRRHGRPPLRLSVAAWREAICAALPLGLAFIVIQVYVGFGALALGYFDGERSVGLYAAPQKIVLFLTSVAGLFGSAIFPRLVLLRELGQDRFERLLQVVARVMVVLGLPLAVGGTLLAPALVRFFYGASYEASVPVFRLLIWSVMTVFGNVPFAYALLAADRRKSYLTAALAGAAVNIGSNLVLIPRLHLQGPAVSTICSEVVVLAVLVVSARRVARVSVKGILASSAGATGLMVVALRLAGGWPFLGQVGLGAAVYAAGLLFCRGVHRSDLAVLRDAVAPPAG
jgi:O-antigen/teichoic acid export membrane protein